MEQLADTLFASILRRFDGIEYHGDGSSTTATGGGAVARWRHGLEVCRNRSESTSMSDDDMTEARVDELLGEDVNFPALPSDENPEDSDALRLIVTGQQGQGNLYETLEKTLKREMAFLVRMLRKDWERHFPALITEGRRLYAKFAGVEEDGLDELEAQPSLEELKKLCNSVNGGTPGEVLEFLGAFAHRSFVCSRLIPWKSDAASVFEFFAQCVEAEDHHMELVVQFASLVDED